MIPADHITIDGDTAWVLLPFNNVNEGIARAFLDRPCDTCGGRAWRDLATQIGRVPCPACDGSGRHTFEIEAQVPYVLDGKTSLAAVPLRVHVIEVLPIVRNGICGTQRHVVDRGTSGTDWHVCSSLNAWEPITLPPTTKPRMWAVKLAVHS